jgi:predicted nucleic acid-binding protein
LKIVIDTNVLVQIMRDENSTDLVDPVSGWVIDRLHDRASALVEAIDQAGDVVIIPAPVLAEYLIGIDRKALQSHLNIINSVNCIEVVSFDQVAAIECALLIDDAELKMLDPQATKAKLRVDRQILAIARAAGAKQVWTHDRGLYNKAKALNLDVHSLGDIEPKPEQQNILF